MNCVISCSASAGTTCNTAELNDQNACTVHTYLHETTIIEYTRLRKLNIADTTVLYAHNCESQACIQVDNMLSDITKHIIKITHLYCIVNCLNLQIPVDIVCSHSYALLFGQSLNLPR
jgi:hypothetical protein